MLYVLLTLATVVGALEKTVVARQDLCPAGEVPWPQIGKSSAFDCQKEEDAAFEAKSFIYANMPQWDVLNNGTLAEGIIGPTVNLSLAVRQKYPWAAAVPRNIWQDYVLPYASVNEARTDWRQFMTELLTPLVKSSTTQAASLSDVADVLNKQLWSVLRPQGAITFKSEQTPLIYDPMSTITFGYASCTGVSILFVDVLRTFGVPARLVGTPAWHGQMNDGNHNWVEVWLGKGHGLAAEDWAFIEGAPAGPGEKLSNPCDKWFCNPQHFDGATKTFAAQFNKQSNTTTYPMAWDLGNREVPGVDRSAYYNAICRACKTGPHSDLVSPMDV